MIYFKYSKDKLSWIDPAEILAGQIFGKIAKFNPTESVRYVITFFGQDDKEHTHINWRRLLFLKESKSDYGTLPSTPFYQRYRMFVDNNKK